MAPTRFPICSKKSSVKFCFRDPLKTGTEHTCITAVDSRPVRFAEASFEYLLRTTGLNLIDFPLVVIFWNPWPNSARVNQFPWSSLYVPKMV
ncbi:unnamed protein product [Acanthoscelides obtectus]|uniref:Uncharacterized protein n=1 Tax=Acanthoscelides obtectus TaxID=200917 RepID=A0A9P0PM36_ACAOB|nr:unnamed protein product [Acanthoscelides obtectus]CAK1637928.1 hypothetical protein AOBTE_LOCUS10296 [Acanthoscelides obtectus]